MYTLSKEELELLKKKDALVTATWRARLTELCELPDHTVDDVLRLTDDMRNLGRAHEGLMTIMFHGDPANQVPVDVWPNGMPAGHSGN